MFGRISSRLGSLNDAQTKQAKAICEQVAAEEVKADTYKTDPYLKLNAAADNKAVEKIQAAIK